eukprot:10999198-Heterocapsa_arctica.AAC.1
MYSAPTSCYVVEKSIRWVKAHLKKENATKARVCFEDWFGNNEADIQAKELPSMDTLRVRRQ